MRVSDIKFKMPGSVVMPAMVVAVMVGMMMPSQSRAEWVSMGDTVAGDTFYVELDKVKKQDGSIYFWSLIDYLKPDEWKDMSSQTLHETDCRRPFKLRKVYATYHTQPMGRGEPSTISPDTNDWWYPPSDSMMEFILEEVCSQ